MMCMMTNRHETLHDYYPSNINTNISYLLVPVTLTIGEDRCMFSRTSKYYGGNHETRPNSVRSGFANGKSRQSLRCIPHSSEKSCQYHAGVIRMTRP